MKSWPDDDLVLHLYGEHPRGEELARDLRADPELADRFARLARELSPLDLLEAPEPDPDLEARTWRALRPRLTPAPAPAAWRRLLAPTPAGRLVALAAALVAVVGAAFWAGRLSVHPADPGPAVAEVPAEPSTAADRVLRASLAGHFESAGVLLTDLTHAPAEGELAAEREWAATLLASNRLYRQAAERAGQRRIVALLDELEPLLVELAHQPAGGELDGLQHRLSERDLLFKLRIVGGRLASGRATSASGAPPALSSDPTHHPRQGDRS